MIDRSLSLRFLFRVTVLYQCPANNMERDRSVFPFCPLCQRVFRKDRWSFFLFFFLGNSPFYPTTRKKCKLNALVIHVVKISRDVSSCLVRTWKDERRERVIEKWRIYEKLIGSGKSRPIDRFHFPIRTPRTLEKYFSTKSQTCEKSNFLNVGSLRLTNLA